jgi:phosphoribosylpyrophosphate synthetase
VAPKARTLFSWMTSYATATLTPHTAPALPPLYCTQVQTGGTLINCAECVKKQGAVAVSCFVTHAVFPHQSWKKFVAGKGPFETFFITDSIPQVSGELSSQPPFEVISLAPLLGQSVFDSIYQS